jgi:hypothetical protein
MITENSINSKSQYLNMDNKILNNDNLSENSDHHLSLSFQTKNKKNINIKVNLNDNLNVMEQINNYCTLHHYSENTKNEIIEKIQENISNNMKELEEDINNENCSNELNELYNLSQNEKENDIEENNLEKKININNFSTEQPPPVTRKKEESNNENNNNLSLNSFMSNKNSKKNQNEYIITPTKKENTQIKIPKKNVSRSNEKTKKKNNIFVIKKKSNIKGEELGQEMYRKAMDFKKKKESRRTQEQNYENYNFKKEFTFIPKINEYSKRLNKSSDIGNRYKNMNVEDRLIEQGKQSQLKVFKKFAQKNLINELYSNNGSFTPIINKNRSPKIKKKNYFESLFNDAKNYKQKKKERGDKEFQEKHPFHPIINKKSKNYKIPTHSCKNIFHESKYVNNNPKEISGEIIIEVADKNPKKKEKEIQNNIKNITIIKENESDRLNTTSSSKKSNITKKNWMNKAQEMIEKEQINKYKEIFNLLDHDKDNFISYDTLNTSNFSQKVLNAISPLLNEIIENKEEMVTFNEFYERAQKILPKLFK